MLFRSRDPDAERHLGGRTVLWPDNRFSFSFRRGVVTGGVSSSSITFGHDAATLDYVENGTAGRLALGLDGIPAENPAEYAGHSFPVLATGAWDPDGALIVDLRSIMNTAHRRIRFFMDNGQVGITILSTPNTAAMTNPPPAILTAAFEMGD